MAKTNVSARKLSPKTHEGGRATRQDALTELIRAVSSCLLFEKTYYESGSGIAERIAELCELVEPDELAALAIQARTELKLRHVPLFLARQLARLHQGKLVGDTVREVIQRPDELAEFLAIYWKDDAGARRRNGQVKHGALSAQVKRGLAEAFQKFDAYQLAKWDRAEEVKLRDVLFLCHAKPKDEAQGVLWKQLIDGTLPTPDTWETRLSAGQDKREVWTSLLTENRLGYLALLMNLRNMISAGVEPALIANNIQARAARSKALPFRFISAAKHEPQFAAELSRALAASVANVTGFTGATGILIDVSGSMEARIAAKSDMSRLEAAAGLAILFREVSSNCRVFTFSEHLREVANYSGLPLVAEIAGSQEHRGTYLAKALAELSTIYSGQRLIVITDEQAHDGLLPAWCPRSYLVNVAPYRPGLDVSQGWCRINGWSERLVDWMALEETGQILGETE